MAYLIGLCCEDEIIDSGGGTPGVTAPINETVDFSNVATFVLPWNATRIAKYGRHGDFTVWIQSEDGIYRIMNVEAIPNNSANPTQYTFDFGGVATGYIVIS